MNQTTGKPIVAAFDFDGTLSYGDTLLPFLNFIGSPARTILAIALATPSLVVGPFSPDNRQRAKEEVLKRTIGGMPKDAVRKQCEIFASEKMQTLINPEGMKKLLWHKQQGHRCILISATLDMYLEPWALASGFHDLICSRLEVDSQGFVTGKLNGKNCWGAEKRAV